MRLEGVLLMLIMVLVFITIFWAVFEASYDMQIKNGICITKNHQHNLIAKIKISSDHFFTLYIKHDVASTLPHISSLKVETGKINFIQVCNDCREFLVKKYF